MNQCQNHVYQSRDRAAAGQLSPALNNISFSAYWKNASIKSLSPKKVLLKDYQAQRLMTGQQINGLFEGSPERSNRNKSKTQKTSPTKLTNRDFGDIEFLKPFDEFDKLLSGLPQSSKTNKENIKKTVQCDLTEKFKRDYIFGKVIGQGAESEVRLAISRQKNEVVAIKAYSKRRMLELNRKKVVRREVKILQMLNHGNIVKMLDVVESKNHLSIIMQFLPGISLKTRKCFKQPQCRKVIRNLASALQYLHQRHVAHRDIKLENVIVDKDLTPKLIDFGFSTCIDQNTKTRVFCGTPSYMAPELVQKRHHRGQTADIWALGVLMFVMLVGYFPFVGNSDQQLYFKIASIEYPSNHIRLFKNAFSLIRQIFVAEADQRITASQILKHPWIADQKLQGNRENKRKNFKLYQFHKLVNCEKEKSSPKDNKKDRSHNQNRLPDGLITPNKVTKQYHNFNLSSKISPESAFRGNRLQNSKFLKQTNSLSQAKRQRTLNTFHKFDLGNQQNSKSPCKTYRL